MNRTFSAIRESVNQNRAVLGRWDLSSLIGGAFLGGLTNVVVNLLLTIHVYRVTGSSAIAVSVLFVITFLPNLVVAPLCSGLADQFNRRLLLGACGVGRAALCVLLVVGWPLPLLLLLAFAITSAASISKPARYALVAQLASGHERVAVNSLLMIVSTVAAVVGGVVAGLLTTSTAGRWVFAVIAVVSIAGAALDVVRFRDAPAPAYGAVEDREDGPGQPPAQRAAADQGKLRLRQRLRNGYRMVRHTPALFALTVATTVLWLGLGLHEPLLVVFVDRVLQAPDATYAYMNTVGSVGGVLGAAAATALAANPQMAARSFSIGLIVAGLCFLGFASSTSVLVAFATFFVFSATYGVSNVIDEYLEQELTPDHLRATVIATIGAVGTFGFLIGGAISGFASATLGPAATAAAVGVLIAAAGGYALARLRIPAEADW